MNASTATIYRHALDRPMDEQTGEIGGNEPNVPAKWRFSIDVATSWETAFFDAVTPNTRKIALRSAVVMSRDRGGIFDKLLRLVRFGLGGTSASGMQFVSWIHDADFLRSIDYLIARDEIDGVVNIASPNPVRNREFMKALREAWGSRFGLPAASWMLEMWRKVRHPVARKGNSLRQSQAKQPLFLVAPDKTAGRKSEQLPRPGNRQRTYVWALFHMENWRESVAMSRFGQGPHPVEAVAKQLVL